MRFEWSRFGLFALTVLKTHYLVLQMLYMAIAKM
jgi:hypothetical protein